MKTTFDTPEELCFLNKLLTTAIMHTDRVLDQSFCLQFPDYSLWLLGFRKKAFEYMEEEEPNKYVIEACMELIKQKKSS